MRVFDDVGDRLLGDAIELRRHAAVPQGVRDLPLDVDPNLVQRLRRRREVVQRHQETLGVDFKRKEALRQVTYLIERLLGLVRDLLGCPEGFGFGRAQSPCQR